MNRSGIAALLDGEWALIEPLLPGADGTRDGRPRLDDRKVLNGIVFILRTGSPWRDLPERGPYTTAYNRFQSLGQARCLAPGVRGAGGEVAAVPAPDRFVDRAPTNTPAGGKEGPDHAIGRSRGGLTTKLHVLVDGDGLPIRVVLSPGQASDRAVAPALLDDLPPGRDLVADRGYDAKALLDLVTARGGRAHIPTCRDRKVQRSVDPALYRHRNLVELLQQAQALPPHRNTLRQARPKLPLSRPHRLQRASGTRFESAT